VRRLTELPSSLRAQQEVSPAPARRPDQCRGQWREDSAREPGRQRQRGPRHDPMRAVPGGERGKRGRVY
jgi:hypothetical protein